MKADRPHIEDFTSMPEAIRELHRRAVEMSNCMSELAADIELVSKKMGTRIS
jgi:hypothetical protein